MSTTAQMIEHISDKIASDDVFNSLEFAQFTTSGTDFEITVPIVDFEPIYQQAMKEISEKAFVTRDLEAFIRRGSEHIDAMRQRSPVNGQSFEYMRLSPHSVSRIRDVCAALNLDHLLPEYTPHTYSVENAYGTPRYSVYWRWQTVDIQMIQRSLLPLLSKIIIEYEQARKENRIASMQAIRPAIEAATVRVGTRSFGGVQKPVAIQPVETNPLEIPEPPVVDGISAELRDELEFQSLLQRENSEAVQLSMFVARRYLNKIQDAFTRGIVFTLTIEDFASLMRNRVCHFTGVPLTTDIGGAGLRDRKIPDNYLSIDRVDSNKGYTRDNVVVCAHSVNIAKNRLPEAQFRQITAAAALVQSMTADQREAFNSLMAAK